MCQCTSVFNLSKGMVAFHAVPPPAGDGATAETAIDAEADAEERQFYERAADDAMEADLHRLHRPAPHDLLPRAALLAVLPIILTMG